MTQEMISLFSKQSYPLYHLNNTHQLNFMKRFLLLAICTLCLQTVFAQTDSTKKADATDAKFESIPVEAQFPGGAKAWRTYLEKNLKTDLMEKCVKNVKKNTTVTQTVIVSFQVDKEGKVSDVKAENAKDVCPLLAAEAVRVIEKGPNWIPAVEKGRKVIFRQMQAITWAYNGE